MDVKGFSNIFNKHFSPFDDVVPSDTFVSIEDFFFSHKHLLVLENLQF